MGLQDIMNRVANAEGTDRRPPLTKGEHLLEIESLQMFDSKKSSVTWFLAEVKVLDSDTLPVGSKRAWLQDMTEEWSYTNVKNLFTALMPEASEEQLKSASVLSQLVSPENPAKGFKVRLTVEMRDSVRRQGFQYKYYSWAPYEEAA